MNINSKHLFLLFFSAFVIIFAGIGLRDPWPPDEPRFALMAKEMWDTGNWFFPHRGGQIYPDKPPMVMWMILFFYALIGNLKVAFLLPSALLSVATLWMTFDIAKRLWNPQIGLYAGLLLLVTLHFVLQAKSGQLDAPVAFWVMLGCYGLLRHLILGPAWKWYYLAFFAMGMGIITKGVGFLPVLMLIALIKFPPKWKNKTNKSLGKSLFGVLFLLLGVSVWLVPMLIQVVNNPTPEVLAYRDNILLKQTVDRYADSWAHHQPFYYYILEVIPLFWLPLTLFIPWLIKPIRKAFAEKELRIIYPLTMVVFAVFFFSLSKGKRAEYMLPMLPMFVLVIAPYFEKIVVHSDFKKLLITLVVIVSALFAILGLAGIFEVDKIARLTEKFHVNPWYWMAALGVFGLVVILIFRKSAIKVYSKFIAGLWLSYSFWAMPLVDKAMSTEPMMNAIAKVVPKDAELGIVGFREKLLLHSQWQTTHFGHHHPKPDQQQAAINWMLSGNKNKFLLLNYQFLNDCFTKENSTPYASFHSEKWLLFSGKKLNKEICVAIHEKFDSFTAKTGNIE